MGKTFPIWFRISYGERNAARSRAVRPRSQRLWSLGAVGGLLIGLSILIVGDRFVGHGLRLLGALITAGGLLCAVVRFAGKE